MAEYRQLAIDLVAADGQIDDTELRLLKKHLYADNKIVKAEVDFLLEVQKSVRRKAKEGGTDKFDRFLLKAVQDWVGELKSISEDQLAIIKKLTTDEKIDVGERKKFINKLKKDKSNAGIDQIADDLAKKTAPAKATAKK